MSTPRKYLVLLVGIALFLGGCGSKPFVNASRMFYDTVGDDYAKYVARDTTLSAPEITSRRAALRDYGIALEARERALGMR